MAGRLTAVMYQDAFGPCPPGLRGLAVLQKGQPFEIQFAGGAWPFGFELVDGRDESHALPPADALGIIHEGKIDPVFAADGYGELLPRQRAPPLPGTDALHDESTVGTRRRAVLPFEIMQP